MEVKATIKILKEHKHLLTKQQFKTLRGQAIAGQGSAALKGLNKIIRREQKQNA